MLWRCSWIKQRRKLINTLSFSSFHTHSSPKPNQTSQLSPPLTHDDVYSRLRASSPDLKTLTFFIRCAKQNNYFHDDRAFNHMVSVVERLTHQHKSIDGIIEGLILSGCAIKPRVLLLLLEIFWRGHVYDKAIEVYRGMSRFGYVPNTRAMNMMMDVLFKYDLVDRALEVLQGIRVRNFFSFDIALSHLCSKKDLVRVKMVLKMMIREGFYPNGERFGQVLGVFCRKGCVAAEGLQVVGMMICSGVSVSVNVWSMLVSGFFRSGEPGKAVELVNKMVRIGFSLNLVTYTSLIKGFMDSGMVGEALGVVSVVQSKGLAPDIVLCNAMIHMFTRLGRFDEARKVFLYSLKRGADRYTFATMLSSLCLSKDFDLGITIGTETELDLVMGNSLMNYLCKVGNATAALKVFRDMSNRDLALDCYTYTGFLAALCRGEAPRDAVNMYNEIVKRKSGVRLDARFHTVMIDSLVELGEYGAAIRLFNRCVLERREVDVVTYTVAIKGLVRGGRMEEACSLLEKMRGDGVMPNARTYRTVISGLCEEKDKDGLREVLRGCVEEGVELDPNTKFKVVSLLSRYPRDCSEFRSVFEKWRDNVDVYDSSYDDLSVSAG
ncbi:putative pentatricopeptide repeat-containing protein [Raphanus sativus]|uniref:Pentatricopeptide repeat-containing protein At1g16830 n=1 Tax=Raphanus sativus TaxID=3726 RepID=A0A6J0JFL9_RAPSA|nr:putative pentatricopeptide repeat-containing protein At1g16830 [Raphanus sativus]KAJ4915979.1 putative pentatricopeptide repeat-containing protein [Raphanus sativus]